MLVLVVLLRVMFIDAVFHISVWGNSIFQALYGGGGIGLKFYRRSCKPRVPVQLFFICLCYSLCFWLKYTEKLSITLVLQFPSIFGSAVISILV